MAKQTTEEWAILQKKIFTRWVNQKLAARNEQVGDLSTAFSSGASLVSLVEILSEKKCEKKLAPAKMRVNKIDNVNIALNFLNQCKIEFKLKPSAENVVDGEEKQILGMTWGIMRKYMKFGDDDEQVDAEQALLMWVKNQIIGYKHVDVQEFPKSFQSGMVLCALIHKFRPKLVNYDSLNPADKEANVKVAFAAAEKYFGLEQFITPAEFLKLDEKSMVVYVGEYYQGIARQRKVDLAARRIGKLIQYTQVNDKMRADYGEKAKSLSDVVERTRVLLADRTIDNTMAGAKKRLDDFYLYKEKDKGVIIQTYLELESLYNNLAMRLADRKRPEFVPAAGVALKDFKGKLDQIEKWEVERGVALQNEFNRQVTLERLNQQHQAAFDKVVSWANQKQAYLNVKEKVDSSGIAKSHLNSLSAYRQENKAVLERNVADLKKIGEELQKNKFEKTADVLKRQQDIDSRFKELEKLAAIKQEILEDDLAREIVKEGTLNLNKQHLDKNTQLSNWGQEKKVYLEKKEEITSVAEAMSQLGVLEFFHKQKIDQININVKSMEALGQLIISAKYESKLSRWVFEKPDEIRKREADVKALLGVLETLAASKLKVLEDDLAREQFKERIRNDNQQHQDMFAKLKAFETEKNAFLSKKEAINSISEAELHLNLLQAYQNEKAEIMTVNVNALKKLGDSIRSAKYETQYSQWKFENPDEVTGREKQVDTGMALLDTLANSKLLVLNDDRDREIFKEKLRQWNKQHTDSFNKLLAWIAEKQAFLEKKESINSVSEAQLHLSLLSVFELDKADALKRAAAFEKFGQEILAANYGTQYSQWKWPTPADVTTRHDKIKQLFEKLSALSANKKLVLQDDLAREQYKDSIRQLNKQHIDRFDKLVTFFNEKSAYLAAREAISSISDAQSNLALLETYQKDKTDAVNVNVAALKKLGKEIIEAQYQTQYSQWKFETPNEVTQREGSTDANMDSLDKAAKVKQEVLDDHLAREIFKEKIRQLNQKHVDRFNKLSATSTEMKNYLEFKDDTLSISAAQLQLSLFAAFENDKTAFAQHKITAFKKLGKEVVDARYETKHSQWKFEKPEEVAGREKNLDSAFDKLTELAPNKKARLDDDLEREKKKQYVRLLNNQHKVRFEKLQEWIAEKTAFLKKEESINSIDDAQFQLSLLEAYEAEKKSATQSVNALKEVGQEVRSAKYETKHSRWVFETPNELVDREAAIDKQWNDALPQLSKQKLTVLQAAFDLEQRKEQARLQFANLGGDIVAWCKDTSEAVQGTTFGFTFAEVSAFQAKLDQSDQDLNKTLGAKKSATEECYAQMTKLGVKENAYTKLGIQDIGSSANSLTAALQQRRAAYNAELAKQTANDQLCKNLAVLVENLAKLIASNKEKITESKEELKAQLVTVEARIAASKEEGQTLPQAKTLQGQIDAAGITYNPHSPLTARDLEAQFAQYVAFLERKRASLNEEIIHKQMRGITAQQYAEIEKQFKQFDKNSNGELDRKEMKACLYSLGEDKTKQEVDVIMKKFGQNDKIKYDGFKEFMIAQLGDSETQDEIVNGFKLIAKGKDVVAPADLDIVMPTEDVEYLKKNATASAAGLSYAAWVQSVYSR